MKVDASTKSFWSSLASWIPMSFHYSPSCKKKLKQQFMLFSMLISPSKISDQKAGVIIVKTRLALCSIASSFYKPFRIQFRVLTVGQACTEEGYSFLFFIFGSTDLSF